MVRILHSPLRAFIGVLLTLGPLLSALPQELRLDGKVRVTGASLEGARAILVSEDGDELVLEGGLARFSRVLRLQTRYLLSVERPGCVTKQIVIDTHVPERHANDRSFLFPFQVILGLNPPGNAYEYAGPVGHVRFIDQLDEFGYDTDYRIKEDTLLQMKLAHLTATVDPVRQQEEPTTRRIPATAVDQQMTVVAPPASDAPVVEIIPVIAPEVAVVPLEPSPIDVSPVPVRIAPDPIVLVHAPVEGELHASHAQTASHDVRPPDAREEWTLVEPRRVTTVVRLTNEGRLVEYRRVAHYSGAIFYFIDGYSCSELSYSAGITGTTIVQ